MRQLLHCIHNQYSSKLRCSLSCLLLLLISVPAYASVNVDFADYFPLAVGNYWELKDQSNVSYSHQIIGTETILEKETFQHIYYENSSPISRNLRHEGGALIVSGSDGMVIDPPLVYDGIDIENEFAHLVYEMLSTVHVPAGTFQNVVKVSTYQKTGGAEFLSRVRYYAPHVGLIMDENWCASCGGTYTFTAKLESYFVKTITQANSFAFRDNEGKGPVLTGQGETFSFGVADVIRDGNNGTTASAVNLATNDVIAPLPNASASMRPGLFGTEIQYDDAQINNQLSPWEITLVNGGYSVTKITPDRTNAPKMEFVQKLSISGPATSPKVTWKLPSTGATVDRVQYELWNTASNQILSGQTPVTLGENPESFALHGLTTGATYAVRIIPQNRDENGTVSRSSNWLGWKAKPGEAKGTVLELVTASPVGASQMVNTPGEAFKVEFDYYFATTTGHLEVFLNDVLIGTVLDAPKTITNGFYHAVFEVEDPLLLDLSSVQLLFQLDGSTGSKVLLDTIDFPALVNGDFEQGHKLWTKHGSGSVTGQPAPIFKAGMSPVLKAAVSISALNEDRKKKKK